jgi:hypothetical protein
MTKLVENPPLPKIGDVLIGREGPVTPQQLVDYGSGFLSACASRELKVGANIHTDVEVARQAGLAMPIVDGMLSSNYLSSMLTRYYGRAFIETGKLRTKFIRQIPAMLDLKVRGQVMRRTVQPSGKMRYFIDVWVEDPEGNKLTVGDANVDVDE